MAPPIRQPLAVLIEGRDYAWSPAADADLHSLCHLLRGERRDRVAALAPCPARSGWLLHWGDGRRALDEGPWAPQRYRFILDARDAVARRLPHFLATFPHP
jgi:hypothetical protein